MIAPEAPYPPVGRASKISEMAFRLRRPERAVAAIVTAGLLWLAAPEALAHGGAPGSPTSPLSIALGVVGLLLLVGGGVCSSKGMRRTGLSVFLVGVAMIALAGADIAKDSSRPNGSVASVAVISPASGEVVRSPVEFKVDVGGALLLPLTETQAPAGAGHLHVYVDGKVVDMPTSSEFSVAMKPGKHTVQVEFTGPDHVSFDPPVQTVLQLEVRDGEGARASRGAGAFADATSGVTAL